MKRPGVSLLAAAFALPIGLAAPGTMAQPFPPFTHPTNITNPFYPVSNTKQAITVGVDDGDEFRSEVTLLPGTRAITWSGGVTQVRVSQYVAYKAGDLVEVAYDYFAQADNGDLYYFGEDVFNYVDGEVNNTNGTWLAGRDGAPPGVIMPANPMVNQVFHPENFRPLVWEEDTVVSLMQAVQTPQGLINNGLLIHELLLDNTEELKIYARGFGQVAGSETGASSHLAIFNRNSVSFGRIPPSLYAIESLAEEVVIAVPNWRRVTTSVDRIRQRWYSYRPQAIAEGAPAEFVTLMGQLVTQLRNAVIARNAVNTNEAANDLRSVAVDLMTFYNPRVPADLKRLQVLERELIGDARVGDWTEALVFHAKAADAVWARVRPFVLTRPGGAARAAELDELFADQADAISAHHLQHTIAAARDAIDTAEEIEDRY